MKSNRREVCSEELRWLIHLESELVMTAAYLRVFGSLPEGQNSTIIAYWAGYEFTVHGLEHREWNSENYADVAASVRAMGASINEQDWTDGCQQAEYELSQLTSSRYAFLKR